MRLPSLLLLTDRHQLPAGFGLVETVAGCAAVGLRAVVLRELDLPERSRAALASSLKATGATVVSARTRLDGADAVHLASWQEPPASTTMPFGQSCHDAEELARAVAGGASWLTISPVAASSSKPGHGPPIGTAGVRRAAALAGSVPVYALGGVDASNAAAVREAGAHGVAVMGAVMRSADPAATVAALLEELA